MPYLLDSDFAIRAMSSHPEAVTSLRRLAPRHLAISVVTMAEIFEGAFNSPNPSARLGIYRRFLAPFRLITLNEPIVELFAELRSSLRRRGEIIPDFDFLVAATALNYDLTVLTFDQRHYRRIPDLKIYSPS
jgi:tRNA(fMet)-specific endonuclease VapC